MKIERVQVSRVGQERGTCTFRGDRGRSGRRFSQEAAQFLRGFVFVKVRGVFDFLEEKGVAAWSRRWQSLFGCVVANFFASFFVDRVPPGADTKVLLFSDVLGVDQHRFFVIVVVTH